MAERTHTELREKLGQRGRVESLEGGCGSGEAREAAVRVCTQRCVCACVCVCANACVHMCVCARARVCECVCGEIFDASSASRAMCASRAASKSGRCSAAQSALVPSHSTAHKLPIGGPRGS